mgnify:CR=1 FL=1
MRNRFGIFFVVFLLAVVLQLKIHYLWGFSLDFALGVLIVAAWFLSLRQLFLLVSLGIFVFFSSYDFDLFFFGLIPFVAYFIKRILPWQGWFSAGLVAAAGTLLFYVVLSPGVVISHTLFFSGTAFIVGMASVSFFFIFESLYGFEA